MSYASVLMPALASASSSSNAFSPAACRAASSLATSALKAGVVLPLGVLGRLGLHLIEHEHHLRVLRVLGPQRAVVVEHGDALCRRHIGGRALALHVGDELEDRVLVVAVAPRRQGIAAQAAGAGGAADEHEGHHMPGQPAAHSAATSGKMDRSSRSPEIAWSPRRVTRELVGTTPVGRAWTGSVKEEVGQESLVPGTTAYLSRSVMPCRASSSSSMKKLPLVVLASLVRIR